MNLVQLLLLLGIAGATWCLLRVSTHITQRGTVLLGSRTESDLAQMFVFIGARQLLWMTLIMLVLATLIARLLRLPWAYLPAVLLLAALAPRVLVRVLRAKRRRRISLQLPDALALWAGLLRAGLGVMPALSQVAQRQPGPLGEEWRLLLNQLRLGLGIDTAFAGLRDRVGQADLAMLSTLLRTHRELGGNLAESLQRLADLLRQRLAMEARIASLTAQGRLQGIVVGVLPLLLLAVLYFMEPAAMRMLHSTWQGWVALGLIALLEACGFLLIRRIVRIDV
jgi:tight adherence protein B